MTTKVDRVLSAHERAVAARVLSEEADRRTHVVVSLSGAHAYGFPSPDSDLDIKCVHLEPTESLLGFPRSSQGAERLEIVDGVEIDYSSNELGGVLLGVLKGNGNFIERFLSGFTFSDGPELEELQTLVRGALSRRVYRHYLGFATQQRTEWERTGCRSAKRLLYVLRTVLTGAHLLQAGEVVTDLGLLLEPFGLADARGLIEEKRRGERTELPEGLSQTWRAQLDGVFARLDTARASSLLPETPANEHQIEAWLVARRVAALRQG